MNNRNIILSFVFALLTLNSIYSLAANRSNSKNDEYPSATPEMIVETETGETSLTEYSGAAPLIAKFYSNIENADNYIPLYEWKVYKDGNMNKEIFRRDVADFDYTFMESGSYKITLDISFVDGTDTIEYNLPTPFSLEISTSVLNVPNAFSPNGDGVNDIFRVKPDHKSIIEFHGYIFNRFGTKLFEWTDINEGWDGTYKGSPVADGAYYVRIDAKGADGRKYDIKKAVNILRGYTRNSTGQE